MTLLRFALIVLLACANPVLSDLQSDVQEIVDKAEIHGGHVGVCIIDTETNEMMVSIDGSRIMIPASNQKLLTTGAALHVLGPSFKFKTKLVLDGNNLIVIGDGDPTIGDTELNGIADWSTENSILAQEFQPWIDAVINSNIKEIDTIFVDDRIFDRNFVHPSWPPDQINNWYCAQVSGLNYHLNVVHFFPSPRNGTTANLGDIAPPMDWISFINKTTSKTGKTNKSSFWVARTPNSNKMTARGNVKSNHKQPVKVAIHDPAIIFGKTLASHLSNQGIKVNKVRHIDESPKQVTGHVIYENSTPLEVVLKRCNTDSHNLYSEALLKRISAATTGQSGTFDEGAKVVEAAIFQRLGVNRSTLTVADGSGMSRDNKINPQTLAKWLASFDVEDPVGKRLVKSLATPGYGTLDNRFKKTNLSGSTVHAKSGYLRGVCALSGFILFENKKPTVFCIIANGVKGTVRGVKKMQEEIVEAAINN